MSDVGEEPWSDKPNAPQTPSSVYYTEKEKLAGDFIGAISYGIVVTLFFQCMTALLDPANNIKRSVKWGLAAHTVAMFSFLSIPTAIALYTTSMEWIDNRNFTDTDELPPGPIGYDPTLNFDMRAAIFDVMFPLNQWLADGLLLYRCYVIYSANRLIMAFPCLIYLASVVMGIVSVYGGLTPRVSDVAALNYNTSYNSIYFALDGLLTIMIVTRLVLHNRNIRNTMGTSDRITRLYTTIASMVVESYALYAIAFLLFIVPWAAHSTITYIFSGLIGATQVIAPYLIILRVANRRALTSEMITSASGNLASLHFKSQLTTTDDDRSVHDGLPIGSIQANGETSDVLGTKAGSTVAVEDTPI